MTAPSTLTPAEQAAESALGELSETEREILRCFAAGHPAKFNRSKGGRAVARARGEFLRWLCANGSSLQGAKVGALHAVNLVVPDPDLDLCGLSLDFPLWLEDCELGCLLLRDARLLSLKLSGTRCQGIEGDRLRVAHGVLLDCGFAAFRRTWLPSARIGDDLNCKQGNFGAGVADSVALLFDGAHVDGRIFLNDTCVAPALAEGGKEAAKEAQWPEKTGSVSGQGARIGGNLVCIGATFKRNADGSALNLQSAVIGGDGAFEDMKANGGVQLRQTRFAGTLTFLGCDLPDQLELTRASVGGDVDFGRAQKDDGRRAKLGSKLLFEGAAIAGRLDFGTADLALTSELDFSRARIGYLDDHDTDRPASAAVYSEGISLGGIAVSQPMTRPWYERLPGIGNDPDNSWLGKRLRWLCASGSERWSPQPYGQVAQALRLAGEDKLARNVAIERERERRKNGGLTRNSQAWNWILRSTIAYGYKPYRAFLWGLGVIAVGWLIFRSTFGTVKFQLGDHPPHFYPLVFSLDVFLPIIDFGQAGERTPQGLLANLTYWIEIGLGWLLTTLGIAGVTGLVRKD